MPIEANEISSIILESPHAVCEDEEEDWMVGHKYVIMTIFISFGLFIVHGKQNTESLAGFYLVPN